LLSSGIEGSCSLISALASFWLLVALSRLSQEQRSLFLPRLLGHITVAHAFAFIFYFAGFLYKSIIDHQSYHDHSSVHYVFRQLVWSTADIGTLAAGLLHIYLALAVLTVVFRWKEMSNCLARTIVFVWPSSLIVWMREADLLVHGLHKSVLARYVWDGCLIAAPAICLLTLAAVGLCRTLRTRITALEKTSLQAMLFVLAFVVTGAPLKVCQTEHSCESDRHHMAPSAADRYHVVNSLFHLFGLANACVYALLSRWHAAQQCKEDAHARRLEEAASTDNIEAGHLNGKFLGLKADSLTNAGTPGSTEASTPHESNAGRHCGFLACLDVVEKALATRLITPKRSIASVDQDVTDLLDVTDSSGMNTIRGSFGQQ